MSRASITLRNCNGADVLVEEGKYYCIDPDQEAKSYPGKERYGSGIIFINRIDIENERFFFTAITAKVANESRNEGESYFDAGSRFASWVVCEENLVPENITLSFEELMK